MNNYCSYFYSSAFIKSIIYIAVLYASWSCVPREPEWSQGKFVAKGKTFKEKTLSLTYDDGPTEISLRIGQYLYANDISATFFVNGNKIAGNEHILEELVKMGHLIGNHTWSHKALDTIPADEVIREVQLTHNLIKKYTPETKRQFLRPPYGRFTEDFKDSKK